MQRLTVIAVLGLLLVCCSWTAEAWGNQHCTWHGTAPACMPSCPSGKKKVEGTESACGPNKMICCVTGEKWVCCPDAWTGNAAEAIAIAKH